MLWSKVFSDGKIEAPQRYRHYRGKLREHDDGPWVKYSDIIEAFETLLAENSRLTNEAQKKEVRHVE